MNYKNGFLSSADLSGLVMNDRDTALLAIGTAFGGLQTMLLKRALNEQPHTGRDIITSPSGLAAIAVGLTFIGVGVGTRVGTISFNKDAATLMLGYGISAIISLGINYVTSYLAASQN